MMIMYKDVVPNFDDFLFDKEILTIELITDFVRVSCPTEKKLTLP